MKFTKGNRYLPRNTYTFNLPSGYSCPAAVACAAYADRESGRVKKGKRQEFPCYSAAGERYPAVRKVVWENFYELQALTTPEQMAERLVEALPADAQKVRIHGGGDFFSRSYFDAWLLTARWRPSVHFWAFTKSIAFWAARIGDIPANLSLTASMGGRHDNLAILLNLRTATVFPSREAAEASGMEINENDRLAMGWGPSFALVLNSAKRAKKKGVENGID